MIAFKQGQLISPRTLNHWKDDEFSRSLQGRVVKPYSVKGEIKRNSNNGREPLFHTLTSVFSVDFWWKIFSILTMFVTNKIFKRQWAIVRKSRKHFHCLTCKDWRERFCSMLVLAIYRSYISSSRYSCHYHKKNISQKGETSDGLDNALSQTLFRESDLNLKLRQFISVKSFHEKNNSSDLIFAFLFVVFTEWSRFKWFWA